ncbi:hypothetical protein [Epinotia aporema granulovirus]|uniref:Uncharacterized protein n=1 Tax=Epinotia aporema granulovirus TaxID=166056 RepID=K4EQE5_9BBAC|nr:hypothetical protein [Epinotia aporema granulovirus]AER41488.1 hypothetical protein [Epinotia aporema granulovirus]
MSLKELHQEIIKTQQDIAITYSRIVSVENVIKNKLSERTPNDVITAKLDNLHSQLNHVVELLSPAPPTPPLVSNKNDGDDDDKDEEKDDKEEKKEDIEHDIPSDKI